MTPLPAAVAAERRPPVREASTELLVELDAGSNVTDLLLEQQAANPAHALYRRKGPNGWTDVPARKFLQDVSALAKGLIAGGLEPGDTVAVMSATRYEWTLVDFAIWFAGGVTVPIYETSAPSQVEWILQDAGARRVFAEDRGMVDLVAGVLAGSDLLRDRLVSVVRMDYDGEAPNLASLAAAGTGVTDAELERHRSRAGLDDVASLVYTSGTTGKPKGCEITHGNFALVARNIVAFLPEVLLQDQARTLMFLPLAHVLARAVQVVCLSAGATLGHTPGAAQLLADLGTFRPTFLLVVPRIFEKVRAGAAHKAAVGGKARLFGAAAATAIDYSREQDRQGRGQGTGPGLLCRARHRLFDRLVYPKLRAALGGQVAFTGLRRQPPGPRRCPLFPRRRNPGPRGVRPDRNHGALHRQHARPDARRHRGHPHPRHHHPGGGGRRDPGQGHRRFQGLPRQPAGQRGRLCGRLLPDRRPGRAGRRRLPDHHGPQEGPAGHGRRKKRRPGPLEEKIRAHPLVAHAVVVGDGRPFVAALVTLDPEGLANWCSERGLPPLTVARACADPAIRAAVQEAVDQANHWCPPPSPSARSRSWTPSSPSNRAT